MRRDRIRVHENSISPRVACTALSGLLPARRLSQGSRPGLCCISPSGFWHLVDGQSWKACVSIYARNPERRRRDAAQPRVKEPATAGSETLGTKRSWRIQPCKGGAEKNVNQPHDRIYFRNSLTCAWAHPMTHENGSLTPRSCDGQRPFTL